MTSEKYENKTEIFLWILRLIECIQYQIYVALDKWKIVDLTEIDFVDLNNNSWLKTKRQVEWK